MKKRQEPLRWIAEQKEMMMVIESGRETERGRREFLQLTLLFTSSAQHEWHVTYEEQRRIDTSGHFKWYYKPLRSTLCG